jgi:hypothetical protein
MNIRSAGLPILSHQGHLANTFNNTSHHYSEFQHRKGRQQQLHAFKNNNFLFPPSHWLPYMKVMLLKAKSSIAIQDMQENKVEVSNSPSLSQSQATQISKKRSEPLGKLFVIVSGLA